MKRRRLAAAIPLSLGWMLIGCSGEGSTPSDRQPTQPVELASSPPLAPPSPPEAARPRGAPRKSARISAPGGASIGSSIAIGSVGDKRVLFVADEDARAVITIDAERRAPIATTQLDGSPTQILVASDGRVYAALRDRDEVIALESTGDPASPLEESGQRLETAAEPVGLAASPDGRSLFVASGWGHALAAFSLETGARRFAVDLPREPRGVAVAEDGKRVFISHMVGSTISVVSLGEETPEPRAISLAGADVGITFDCWSDSITTHKRFVVQGFALASLGGRVYGPGVVVHPLPAESSGYGSPNGEFLTAELSVASIDAPTEVTTMRVSEAIYGASAQRWKAGEFNPPAFRQTRPPCLLPRAIAANGARSSLLVACAGIDSVIEIEAKEARLDRSEIGRWKVPAGPMGIAVDEGAREAFVWSRFDRKVSSIALGSPNDAEDATKQRAKALKAPRLIEPAFSVSIATPPGAAMPSDIDRGRRLFHSVGDKRISFDGRACASCHPDGRDDGLVWSTPEGLLQTPMLAGRLEGTGPYGWTGRAKTVEEHVADTFKRLGGKGLKGADLAALLAYITSLPGPRATRPRPADPKVERGHELFTSMDTMCSLCHTEGGALTDGTVHNVSSGISLETPSLRFVAGTPPYFHDGRYATLRDLLLGSAGKMGEVKHLGEADLAALEAYLETL